MHQAQLGHSSLAITDRYIGHIAPEEVISTAADNKAPSKGETFRRPCCRLLETSLLQHPAEGHKEEETPRLAPGRSNATRVSSAGRA